MKTCLEVYLHDHLAGAAFALDLLKSLEEREAGHPLGEFAAGLWLEIEADRRELQRLLEKVQTDSNAFKEAMARLGEKVARLKLRGFAKGEFGAFETLEALALGIQGKQGLWAALLALDDPRFSEADLGTLLDRAWDQHEQVEARRIELARTCLKGTQE